MTPDQALAGLGAIVGGGGISAVLVALLGFLTEARKGRKPSAGDLSITLAPGLNQDKWAQAQAAHLSDIACLLTRLVAIQEIEAEEQVDGKGFGDRLETKTLRLLADLARHGPEATRPG
jgi:ABC-type enterobactin transport system permease subunit